MLKAVATFTALVGSGFGLRQWNDEIDIVDFAGIDAASAFEEWKQQYGQKYSDIEQEFGRFKIWSNNLRRIAQYNSEEHGSSKVRMNQFGGMTDDEFKQTMFGDEGCIRGQNIPRIGGRQMSRTGDSLIVDVPSSVDWTAAGCVTPVKNQGQCGSCWAFSTTGSIECRTAIKDAAGGSCSTPVSLSEQQLVDCSTANYGCRGGDMHSAMTYVVEDGGLCSESEYEYKARNGQCEAKTCGTKYDAIKSHSNVEKLSESAMMSAVAEGCVSVAIEADQFAFQYYSGGVLDGTCGANLDHGVLITGYGVYTNGEKYWKVKNSWGSSWGMDGYVLICRDCGKNHGQGECGILREGLYPNY